MSIQIFADIEESLAREVRRITFNDSRTLTSSVLQDSFDPFTGELVSVPIEPSFYETGADANHTQYPAFFIKILKTREDRFTKRVVPPYGHQNIVFSNTSPKAYDIVISGATAAGVVPGNTVEILAFNVRKVQPGYLLRLLSGNNKGTYIIDTITINNMGPHQLTLKQELVINLPAFTFDSTTRTVLFSSPTDLNTVAAGDQLQDSLGSLFDISSVDPNSNTVVLSGVGTPDLNSGAKIVRVGNVLQQTDLSAVSYLIMDPSKPVQAYSACGLNDATTTTVATNWPIPIDCYYLVRIDSKEKKNHIDILNRVWEEFNPPRSGLPVVVRTALSAEQPLTADVTAGGSSTLTVADTSNFSIGDKVYLIDDLRPTRNAAGEFQSPFESKIVGIVSATQVALADVVPDDYKVSTRAKIVTNASSELLMFHFVEHTVKDNEVAQYWIHEFTFYVQAWVDKFGAAKEYGPVTDIGASIENIDTDYIYTDS